VKSIVSNGVIVAKAKKGGVYLCVARNGQYVSLQRAAGVGKTKFDNFMRGFEQNSLPDLQQARAMQAEINRPVVKADRASTGSASAPKTSVVKPSSAATPTPKNMGAGAPGGKVAPTLRIGAVSKTALLQSGKKPSEVEFQTARKKTRVTATVGTKRPSAAPTLIQEFEGKIQYATMHHPDSVEGLMNELSALLEAEDEKAQIAQQSDAENIASAASVNASIAHEERLEMEIVEAENAVKIQSQQVPSMRPMRPPGSGM
jgi:hypothetical protein